MIFSFPLFASCCFALSANLEALRNKPGDFKAEYFDELDLSGEGVCKELGGMLNECGFGDRRDVQEALEQSKISFDCLHTAYSGAITKTDRAFYAKTLDHFKNEAIKFIALDVTVTSTCACLSPFLPLEEQQERMFRWAGQNSIVQVGLAIFYKDRRREPRKLSILVKPKASSDLGLEAEIDPNLANVYRMALNEGIEEKDAALLPEFLSRSEKLLIFYNATWDIPFLLSQINPPTRPVNFKAFINRYFGNFYDLELLDEMLTRKGVGYNRLQNLAGSLYVLDELEGNCQDAGRNALIIGRSFEKWQETNRLQVEEEGMLVKYHGCSWNEGSVSRYYCVKPGCEDDHAGKTFLIKDFYRVTGAAGLAINSLDLKGGYRLEPHSSEGEHCTTYLASFYSDADVERFEGAYPGHLVPCSLEEIWEGSGKCFGGGNRKSDPRGESLKKNDTGPISGAAPLNYTHKILLLPLVAACVSLIF